MSLKTLYALRHAKAENGASDMRDFDRALTADGLAAAAAVGARLRALAWSPSHVMTSPSRRTVETAETVLRAANHAGGYEKIDTLYLATAGEMFQLVHALPETHSSVLVIGHNPGIQHFCTLLAGHGSDGLREEMEVGFPTAALAVITFSGAWKTLSPGAGTLTHYLTLP